MDESIRWVKKWFWLFLTDEIKKNVMNGVLNKCTHRVHLSWYISKKIADISKKNEAAVVYKKLAKHITFVVIWKQMISVGNCNTLDS
jgi:hypothetical protein